MGGVRGRAPAHPRCAARCGGEGPQATARDPAGEAAAHGGLRAVGDGLRDRAVAGRHVLVGPIWATRQPRRGGGGRDRRRSDRHRRARLDGDADGVDGNRLGPSGALGKVAGEEPSRPRPGRRRPRLGGQLRRAATFLRKIGIEINIGNREGHGRTRTISITTVFSEPLEERNSASAAAAAVTINASNNLTQTVMRTQADANGSGGDCAGAGVDAINGASGRANPLKNMVVTAADATDAERPYSGGLKKEGVRLSDGRIRELAGDYLDEAATTLEETGDVDRVALERRLRENLVCGGRASRMRRGRVRAHHGCADAVLTRCTSRNRQGARRGG